MAPIVTTVVPDGSSPTSGWRNAADSLDLRFSRTAGADGMVRVKFDDAHQLAYGVADAKPVEGRVDGSSLTYPGVRTDADVRLDVRPGALKETLVLTSGKAPRSWTFPLRLTGLTAKVVDGRVALLDEKNVERARFPRGFMVDSNVDELSGDPARSDAVRYEVVERDGATSLKIELDPAWLDDPARRYPVLVDPTIEPLAANASMIAQDDFRDTSGAELKIGHVDNTTAASYLKFDGIENRLHNYKIFSSHLALANTHSYSCRPRPVTVHAVTQPWGTGGGYPGPAYGEALTETSFAHGREDCPATWEVINLGTPGRDLVQRWVDGEQPNYGLTVRAPIDDVYAWKKFAGHAAGSAAPALYVTYSQYNASYEFLDPRPNPPITRAQGGKVKVSATNLGSGPWTQGQYSLGYRIFTESGSRVSEVENAAPLPKDVARGETVNLEPFVEKLDPGKYTIDLSIVHKGVRFLSDDMLPVLRLVLQVYEIPPRITDQYPPNGYPSPVLTPSLWAQALDIAPKPGSSLTYNYQLCEKDSAGADVDCTDSGFLPGQTYTVPANRLRWSKTYYWRVTASNGTVQSPPGPQSALLTVVPQPEITAHLAVAPYSGSNKDFDPQTGNYFSSAIDASVATVGPALTVARTYNSLDPRTDLAFGAGWSSTFDMRVVPDQDGSGNVVVTYPDGQQARFGRNGDGTFAPPSGRYATFRQVDGGWNLQDKASTLYTFGGDGRLRTIVDNQRRTVSLAYDGAGKLKTATSDTSKRALTFTWSGAHVGTVSTEPVGGQALTWTYTYDGDKLTKVCDPKNGCATYDHSTGSHYRSAVADSNPDSYWRLGETTGEVAVSESTTHVGKDNGKYTDVGHSNAGPLSGTGTRAATFNGSSSVVTLPDELAVKSRNLAVELWFRTTASGPLFAQQRKALGEESTGAVPVLYVGRDGKLRGEFWHGSVNPVTTPAPVNDGQWHHVLLSGSLGTQTLYLDGARVGSVDGTIAPEDVPFNQIGAGYAAGSWPQWGPGPRWHFTGDIAEVALYQHPVGDTAAAAHFKARASATQLARITLPSGRTAASLTYDTVNDRLKESVDENGGLWRIGTPSATGDETNPIVAVSVTDPGNRFHDYAYDAARGRVVRYSAPLGLGAREADVSPTTTTTTTPPTCTTPTPPNSGPIFCGGPVTGPPNWETGPIKGQGVRTFDYDPQGFQNTITNEVGAQVRMTYDDRGNLLSSTSCRTSSTDCQTSHTKYFVNAGNTIDPRNDKPVEQRDARSASATDDTYVVKTTYTTFGEVLTRTRPDGTGTSQTYTADSDAAFGGGNTPAGLTATRTDARGQVTRNSYYRNGDLAEVVEPSGLTTRFTYDVLGRKTGETQISDAHPAGVTSTYTYDSLSRPSQVTSPGVRNPITGVTHTSRATTEYDADGRKTKVEVVDLTGGDQSRASTFDYDAHGRLTKTVDADGRESSQGFDVFGNVVWSVDPAGNRTELSYTARNQVAEVRLKGWRGDEAATAGGDLVVQDNAYDHAGRLVMRSDAMGRTQVYTYYQDDKLWKVIAAGFHNSNGTTRDITLQENSYDAAGALVKQVAGGGQLTTVHEIDALGRIASTTVDPDRVQRRMSYTYDAGDNIVREVRSGRPSNVPFTASASSTVLDHVYDGPGRRISDSTLADGVALTTSRTYDQRGDITSSTDPRGNVEGATAEDFTT
ncbi:MAG TPA: LamG-like jellyroll fold domain-containing protein, partial [Umezawaea sp.]|nr:LamG-like jellyroll fold domain-containing protein [Umezawaea sp.]